MKRLFSLTALILIAAAVVSGCASSAFYIKRDAPWKTIQKVGVFKFETPSEDQVRRTWATELFITELRRTRRFEVVELDEPPPRLGPPDWSGTARKAEVDAYIRATVEDLTELFADVRVVDAATDEMLYSMRYQRGSGLEFSFRSRTDQQQLNRIFRIICKHLVRQAK